MPGTPQVARNISDWHSAEALRGVEWNKAMDDLAAITLNAGVLAISAGGSALAKITNAIEYIIAGVIARLAAANMPALAGTILQNNFGGWVFTVNAAGVVAARFMTQGASLATVVMPVIPVTDAVIGYVRLNPTAANFVGGTTLLDAANTNAIYVDTPAGLAVALGVGTGVPAKITSPVGL